MRKLKNVRLTYLVISITQIFKMSIYKQVIQIHQLLRGHFAYELVTTRSLFWTGKRALNFPNGVMTIFLL